MNLIMQSKQFLCQTTIAFAVNLAGLQAQVADTLEIHVTRNDGKEYILPVDRDASSLSFYGERLTSLILPEGLVNLQTLNLGSENSLTNLTLPNDLWNLTSLDFAYYGGQFDVA